jgi:hypothetical protein
MTGSYGKMADEPSTELFDHSTGPSARASSPTAKGVRAERILRFDCLEARHCRLRAIFTDEAPRPWING